MEELNHVQDVSRAWDSLLEAKHVLQRIENKVDIRDRAQKIRRRLQLDGNAFSGLDSCSPAVIEHSHPRREEMYRRKPNQTFTIHSKEPHNIRLSPTMDPLPDASKLTWSSYRDGPPLFSCNQGGMKTTQYSMRTCREHTLGRESWDDYRGGRGMDGRCSLEEHAEHVLVEPGLCVPSHHPEHMTDSIPKGTFSLSVIHVHPETRPCSPPEASSPLFTPKSDLYAQKLEYLKSRSPTNKLELLKERIREQKRRQDAFKRSQTKSLQDPERTRRPGMTRKVCKATVGPQPTICKAFRCSKDDGKTVKSRSPVSRKLSFKSPLRETTDRKRGLDLYGASAWREGQKRVLQLLGPSPGTVMTRRVAGTDAYQSHQGGHDRKTCHKTASESHPKQRRPPCNRESAEGVGTMQSRDPSQVLTEVSAGNKGTSGTCKMLGKDRENIEDIRSKSVSPKRPHVALDNPEKRSTGKENVRLGNEEQPKSAKARGYSVEAIRSFMKKKNIERQKEERENRRKMHKAEQMRRQQLHRVLRKQRDAFPPKRPDTAAGRRDLQMAPGVTGHLGHARKVLSWLHVMSSDLLREEDGSSGKTRRCLPEDPLHTESSSPLRLRDLATVLSDWQPAKLAEVTSQHRLYPDAVHEASGLSSQYKSSQERVQALWALAKDLGKRVENEANRLGCVHRGQQSLCAETPASPKSPSRMGPRSGKSPVPAGTKAAQTEALQRPSANTGVFPGRGGILSATSTSGNTDLLQASDRSKVSPGQLKKRLHGINKEHTQELASPTGTFPPNVHTVGTQESCFSHQPDSTRTQRGSECNIPEAFRGRTLSSPRRKPASPAYSDKMGSPVPPLREDSSSPVTYLHQTRMDISDRMKVQIAQQEMDLASLRHKARLEAQEAGRCLQEMLQRNTQQVVIPPVTSPGVQDKKQQRHSHHKGITEQGLSVPPFEADLEGPTDSCGTRQNLPVQAHATLTATAMGSGTAARTWDLTEPATDSTSQWSEVSELYGSPNMFSRLTLEMVQQYLREEELRARHQAALLRLREEALKEKTKAELALLQHQRAYCEMRAENGKLEDLLRQEQEIQKSLKQEQAEIRHLHNMYKAAHQKRKLLLQQQKEIMRIRRSAAHMQRRLQSSAVAVEGSDRIDHLLSRDDTLRHSTSSSSDHPHQNTQSAISDLSADDDVTENVEAINIDWAQVPEDVQPPHGPEGHQHSPVTRRDPQTRNVGLQELGGCLVTQDGAVLSNPLSGDGQHVTNPCQKSPPAEDNLRNHSQEKPISANEDDSGVFANTPETFTVPAKERGDALSVRDQERTTDPKQSGNTEGQQGNSNEVTSEAAEDARMVTEPTSDHSSYSLSAPSASNVASPASDALCPSLAEFHKVYAKLINISESSVSDREQNGQDTESGDSEVFDMEPPEMASEEKVNGDSAGQTYFIHPDEGGQAILSPVSSRNKENPEVFCSSDVMSDEATLKPPSSPLQAAKSRSPAEFFMEETEPKTAPLASESFPTSEDLTESDRKTYSTKHLPDNQRSNAVSVPYMPKPTSMRVEDVSNVAGMSSPDTKDRQGVTETNGKPSVTENVIFRKSEMGPFHATASKDLFPIKSFPHRSEGEIIFISEEVLEPVEDALSEILSPVDEKLSYESADLFSTQQERSEELPSFPTDGEAIKSGESNTEDFPSPPEEFLLSGTESLHSSREASLIDEIHLLYGSLLAEDTLLPPAGLIPQQLYHDGHSGTSFLETEDTRNSPEVIKQRNPFLTLSKADEDIHDPLYAFQIGDRVLVKLSKPGTLKFKGLTFFKEGHWAGVALDKAEGDNDGTYEGVKYFECSKNCGIFVRPGQISHLLFDEKDKSDQLGDDHSFDEGPSPSNFQSPEQAGGDLKRRQQGDKEMLKPSSEKDINQSWSRGLESSKSMNVLGVADHSQLSSDVSPSFPDEPIREDTDPGQALQIKHLYGGDTNGLISPHPLQKENHALLVRGTDQPLSRGLCDAIGTITKESQQKCEDVDRKKPETDASDREMDSVINGGRFNPLPSGTSHDEEIGGQVESIAHILVTKIIMDCIKEYKKRKRIQGKENKPWSPKIYFSSLLSAAPPELRTGLIQGISEDTSQRVTEFRSCGKSSEPLTHPRGALSLHVTNLQGK